jgi:hypothetical protein
LRLRDLYWGRETSYAGLFCTVLFGVVGVILLSAIANPVGYPIASDIAYGILALALAPFIAPAVGIWASGKIWLRGRTIHIHLDEEGLTGWPVPSFRETTWSKLRHPRLERTVLVLPFSWPFADSWVPIPARAFTEAQFDEVVSILQRRGHLLDESHRSSVGRFLSFAFDRRPTRRSGPRSRLKTFPTVDVRQR